jgi:hypothetical protein
MAIYSLFLQQSTNVVFMQMHMFLNTGQVSLLPSPKHTVYPAIRHGMVFLKEIQKRSLLSTEGHSQSRARSWHRQTTDRWILNRSGFKEAHSIIQSWIDWLWFLPKGIENNKQQARLLVESPMHHWVTCSSVRPLYKQTSF